MRAAWPPSRRAVSVRPSPPRPDRERAEQQRAVERAAAAVLLEQQPGSSRTAAVPTAAPGRTPRRPEPATSVRTGASARNSTPARGGAGRQQADRAELQQRDDDRDVAGGRRAAGEAATAAARNAVVEAGEHQFAVGHGQCPGASRTAATPKSTAPAASGRGSGPRSRRGPRARGAAGPRCRPRRWSCRLPRRERPHLVHQAGDLERLGQVGVGAGGEAGGDVLRRMRRPTAAGCGCRRSRGRRAARCTPRARSHRAWRRRGRRDRAARRGRRPARRRRRRPDVDDGAAGLARPRGDEGADVVLVVGDEHADGGAASSTVAPVGQAAPGTGPMASSPGTTASERVPAARRERPSPLGVSPGGHSRRQPHAPRRDNPAGRSRARWVGTTRGSGAGLALHLLLGLLGLALHVLRRRTGPRP